MAVIYTFYHQNLVALGHNAVGLFNMAVTESGSKSELMYDTQRYHALFFQDKVGVQQLVLMYFSK